MALPLPLNRFFTTGDGDALATRTRSMLLLGFNCAAFFIENWGNGALGIFVIEISLI
jgi:hypothetical protein